MVTGVQAVGIPNTGGKTGSILGICCRYCKR